MTFICAVGQHPTEPREKMTKIVTQRRDKTYYTKDGSIRKGWEIVKEESYCPDHAKIKLMS